MQEPRDSESGFSLIEVAVAVALLSILTVSTLLTLIPVSRQTRLNREMESASAAVRDLMERVHATPFSEIPSLYPDGTVVALASLESGEVTIGYEDVTADPLIISFDLAWDSPQVGSMSRTFTTVKTE
ncbi:MAG: type II secretion system protein [Planctomycetota bacterium]